MPACRKSTRFMLIADLLAVLYNEKQQQQQQKNGQKIAGKKRQ